MKIVILSKDSWNLIPCVRAIRENEPELPPGNIIVVDDGVSEFSKSDPTLEGITWVSGVKPFIFSRNANLGIWAANDDVILLNDDAILTTPRGFSDLAVFAQNANYGLVSPVFKGLIGNPAQRYNPADDKPIIRIEPRMLCFVCVFISKRVQESVGELDERFTAYGYEDDDYCRRVRNAGLELAIYKGCVLDHGKLRSAFRSHGDISDKLNEGRRIYQEKWG